MAKYQDERGEWYVLTYRSTLDEEKMPDVSGPWTYLIEVERAASRAFGTGHFAKVEIADRDEVDELRLEREVAS